MKKIPLFILLQLVWVGLLVGSLTLYHSSLNSDQSLSRTIKIMSGNPKNDELTLSPNTDPIMVSRWRQVTWEIDPASNVKSFMIQKKKYNSKQIFFPLLRPSAHLKRTSSGTVNSLVGKSNVYNYTILWKMITDSDSIPLRQFDPKLAINPNITRVERLIQTVFATFFLLTFGVFFINKKARVR